MATVHSALLKIGHSQLRLTRYGHRLAQSTAESLVSRSSFGLWDNHPQHELYKLGHVDGTTSSGEPGRHREAQDFKEPKYRPQ